MLVFKNFPSNLSTMHLKKMCSIQARFLLEHLVNTKCCSSKTLAWAKNFFFGQALLLDLCRNLAWIKPSIRYILRNLLHLYIQYKFKFQRYTPIAINQESLTISDTITHLGIDRYCSNSKFIMDHFSLARRAMYIWLIWSRPLWAKWSTHISFSQTLPYLHNA